ncbi:CHASE3 domain-containing protein [Pseudonocardia sp. DSM 110487]|uniref:sensor histidine kinase n=1 Tax=Pseudonocardia sp. DSM 110487 TaxID=2865833 RepID=UPI001C69588F|nr:sensor histidine kinase [Pseudonocardia sp. DSM 110487]QYN36195.1 CHASE3 domain-containing protein [Pseudonocardia sp. DSM 110487]
MTVPTEPVRRPRRFPLRLRPNTAGTGRWPLARVFVVGAVLAGLVASGTVVLGATALWRLTEARTALLGQAGPALLAVKDLANAQLDQETGVRGFLLTGRPQFLEPYRAGVASSQDAVNQLRAATDELPAIGPEIDAAVQAEQDWRLGYAEPVIAGDATAPGPDAGEMYFDRVRRTTGVVQERLSQLRLEAREELASAASFIAWSSAAIGVTLLVLLAVVGIGLRRMVLRPVSALAAQVREVVAGDTDRQVDVEGPREIRELGADVDAMRSHILRELDHAQVVNRRLDDQARELERSNRDLEQFAYVASHDLQEPLRKVATFCQLLQRRYAGKLDERADQYIAFAVDGAQRMQQLINDLLAFSRVGRSTENFGRVDLGAVAAAAVEQLEQARDEVGGEIVLGSLPTVPGDPGLLRALMANLIGNGLKFHREGVAPVVRVDAQRDGATWAITVADNGIGIEPEYGEKVFVIFQRLHGRDAYSGTGIGLALAKKIVEFHKGHIGLVPSDGPGTTIRVTLPALSEEAAK